MPPSDETKYAVFLLNQNLTQLLVYTGQWPTDLRATLANLLNLTKNIQLVDNTGDQSSLSSLNRTPYIYGATSSSDLEVECKDVDSRGVLQAEHRK